MHPYRPESFRNYEIGEIVTFQELDKSTVVERANTTMQSGNYLIKVGPDTAKPVIKNADGTYKIMPGELSILADCELRIVGFMQI